MGPLIATVGYLSFTFVFRVETMRISTDQGGQIIPLIIMVGNLRVILPRRRQSGSFFAFVKVSGFGSEEQIIREARVTQPQHTVQALCSAVP